MSVNQPETLRRTATLLPCPFCGSTNIDPEGWASTDRAGPACDDCAGTADTIDLWNTRPNEKRIEVGIGTAAQALQASLELCAMMMNEMVGGPALVEAQSEIERLTAWVAELEATIKKCALTGAICCDIHHQPALGSKVQRAIQSLIDAALSAADGGRG